MSFLQEKVPDLLPKVVESCIKEEMDTCLQEKLQNYLFKEMDTRFKQIEENVVKRMEGIINLRVSKVEEPRANGSHTDRETDVQEFKISATYCNKVNTTDINNFEVQKVSCTHLDVSIHSQIKAN